MTSSPPVAIGDEELAPCPFCGGEAEIINIEDGENAGGSCVSCTRCLASSNLEFEFKENFVSNWNRRSPVPLEALRECQKALAVMIDPHNIQLTSPLNAYAMAVAAEARARLALSHAGERKPRNDEII